MVISAETCRILGYKALNLCDEEGEGEFRFRKIALSGEAIKLEILKILSNLCLPRIFVVLSEHDVGYVRVSHAVFIFSDE